MINLLNKLLSQRQRNKKYAVINIKGVWYVKTDTNREYVKRKFNNLEKAFRSAEKLNENH